jgi:hypothetical protein
MRAERVQKVQKRVQCLNRDPCFIREAKINSETLIFSLFLFKTGARGTVVG